MKPFLGTLKPSLILFAFFTVLLGVLYPLLIFGIGQFCFHRQANGSLFYYGNGVVMGSELIAQNFTKASYFHPRPSAAGTNGYDASSSSGSNLGPTAKKLIDALEQRAAAFRAENHLASTTPIPVDAITASGSGLDPDISIENAHLQAARVAAARSLSEDQIHRLIDRYAQGPTWGIFGTKRINVLRVNLALDQLSATGVKQ